MTKLLGLLCGRGVLLLGKVHEEEQQGEDVEEVNPGQPCRVHAIQHHAAHEELEVHRKELDHLDVGHHLLDEHGHLKERTIVSDANAQN